MPRFAQSAERSRKFAQQRTVIDKFLAMETKMYLFVYQSTVSRK